jgi:DnaK suppressor protein
MNDTERRHIEQRLMQERDRANEVLERHQEHMRAERDDDGDLTDYKQHLADEGTDTMEEEKTLMLLQTESETLSLVDEALQRLYKEPDTFGTCSSCGNGIQLERLDLVPWTQLCQVCQSQQEATEGGGSG